MVGPVQRPCSAAEPGVNGCRYRCGSIGLRPRDERGLAVAAVVRDRADGAPPWHPGSTAVLAGHPPGRLGLPPARPSAGLPLRAQALVGPVREGLRFGLRYGLLDTGPGGGVRQAIPRLRPPDAGDLRAILAKATFAGRWVSRSEQPATVFALLGVTV